MFKIRARKSSGCCGPGCWKNPCHSYPNPNVSQRPATCSAKVVLPQPGSPTITRITGPVGFRRFSRHNKYVLTICQHPGPLQPLQSGHRCWMLEKAAVGTWVLAIRQKRQKEKLYESTCHKRPTISSAGFPKGLADSQRRPMLAMTRDLFGTGCSHKP